MRTLACYCLLLMAVAPAARAQTETSPKGFLHSEASGAVGSAIGYDRTMHVFYFHVDDTQSAARTIGRLALRRDGDTSASGDYVARKVTLTVRLGHAVYAKVASNAIQPEAEYRKGAMTEVFSAKVVALPSLVAQPAKAPAPWSVHLPLDKNFAYWATDALFLQMRASPNDLGTTKAYPLDALYLPGYSVGATAGSGTGCQVAGKASPVTHSSILHNYGNPGVSYWQLTQNGGPANAATLVLIGASDPTLPLGCGQLRTIPDIVLIGQPTNAQGYSNTIVSAPHRDAYIGLKLYTQIAVLDPAQPGLPFALSQGIQTIYPANPTTPAVASGWSWSTGSGWVPSVRMARGRAIVVGLGS